MTTSASNLAEFNRGTGLIVIEVRGSNPNGDPDTESDPRVLEDGRGIISPVSFKRKLRDLLESNDGPLWDSLRLKLNLTSSGPNRHYEILEMRNRDRAEIGKMEATLFKSKYWDARVFGNTFLESLKDKADGSKEEVKKKKGKDEREHFISTGVIQVGPGISVSPIDIERLTLTNKSGVEEGKDRGMAPLGWRVVRHAVYAMPFFVNPKMAEKTGCDARDIELFKQLIPLAYRNTASAIRPFVEIRHAWYAEHKSPWGSCPDYLIVDSLSPKRKDGFDPELPSKTIDEYDIPKKLPEEVRVRLANEVEDLCLRQLE